MNEMESFCCVLLFENSLDQVLALCSAGNSWFQTSLTDGGDVRCDAMRCDLSAALGLSVL